MADKWRNGCWFLLVGSVNDNGMNKGLVRYFPGICVVGRNGGVLAVGLGGWLSLTLVGAVDDSNRD